MNLKHINIWTRHLAVFVVCLVTFMFIAGGSDARAGKRHPMVKLTTNMGEIVLELDAEKAPETTANFLAYVKDGFYDGTVFHRVIPGFMVQGGGMTEDMKEKKTGANIRNEADNGLKNEPYTVAMARTNDPHSASSQFFINVGDNKFLNHAAKTPQGWGYAVFGKVAKGNGVVDRMAAVPTGRKGFNDDVPLKSIIIEKAEVIEE